MSEVNALIRRDSEDNYRLIAEMGELLYYAASGELPYISDDVRKYKYREFSLQSALALLSESLEDKTLGFINLILHAKRQEMRDIMGNNSPAKALSWFITRSETLEWNLEERNECDRKKITESDEFRLFSEKAYSGAKRNTFFRKKGTIIIISLVVAIFVGTFLYDYISNLLEPPVSAGLDQEGVIMSFYDGLSQCTLSEDIQPAVCDCLIRIAGDIHYNRVNHYLLRYIGRNHSGIITLFRQILSIIIRTAVSKIISLVKSFLD